MIANGLPGAPGSVFEPGLGVQFLPVSFSFEGLSQNADSGKVRSQTIRITTRYNYSLDFITVSCILILFLRISGGRNRKASRVRNYPPAKCLESLPLYVAASLLRFSVSVYSAPSVVKLFLSKRMTDQ